MAERSLTVVQLLPALGQGGVERGTVEIAAALVAAGHRALVVSGGGPLVQELEALGAEHHRLPIGAKSLRTLLLVRQLRTWLETARADILHLRSRLPAWIGWLAWRAMDPATRPRLVTTVHGFYSVSRYSAIMTRGERVIAVSDAIGQYVQTRYPQTPPQNIHVIHRGIDHGHYPHGLSADPDWAAEQRSEWDLEEDVPLLLLPGRLTRLKGHETFVRLVASLNAAGQPVCGIVAGGEDARRRAYARSIYAAADGLPIRFIGARRDLRDWMALADVVLSLSSQPESFGRTVLEALALGRPVVGFDHGGVGEILAQLFPEGAVGLGDEETLRSRVTEVLAKPPAVEPVTKFSLARMQQATLALYAALADAPRH
ncbi:MAG: glycosyltransferase family 4 protein [Pseudomonadota bacterium]